MFKAMDQNLARKMLEGQVDVLSREAKQEADLYANVACPMCYQIGAEKRIPPPKIIFSDGGPQVLTSPFSPGRALPVGYAHCIHCNTDFDPHSGIIRKTEATIVSSPSSFPLG